MLSIGDYIIDITFKNNRICFGIIAVFFQVKPNSAETVFKSRGNRIAELMRNRLKINPVIINTSKLYEKIANRNDGSPFSPQYVP